MLSPTLRRTTLACTSAMLLFASGCDKIHSLTSSSATPASGSTASTAAKGGSYYDKLQPIVASHRVQVLQHSDFSDYADPVQAFYQSRNYETAWVSSNHPTAQAAAFIKAFQAADQKGLSPQDFDGPEWDSRVQKLSSASADEVAQFDAAMTVSVMRYLQFLHMGRVNPTHFNFDIDTDSKKLNLSDLLTNQAISTDNVPKFIASVEPDNDDYRALERALPQYLTLAQQQGSAQPLPTVAGPVSPGGSYPGADALRQRLQLEGELEGSPVGTPVDGHTAPHPAISSSYSQPLAEAVTKYQAQHGLKADGKLTPQTIASLNVPMSDRVRQIDDSLERWRWLPDNYLNAPLMVNLPEFVVRGYASATPGHKLDFTMEVVDGQVQGGHETPVFTHDMKYVIFRPFWNVPISIIKKELGPHISRSGVGYLASKGYETVNAKGEQVEASAAEIERGGVVVRQKPGSSNALGLVKFMFPNAYNIYLHSTEAPGLFSRTRRDFSHGCVRVQHPDQLAVWVLRNNPGDWDINKVHEAFSTGPDNHTVSLKQDIPIVIFYLTAHADDDGSVHFFDDIYGYDHMLDEVLSRGMPYPAQAVKVNPNANMAAGDTT